MDDNRPTFWENLAREVSGNASEESQAWAQQQPDQELNEARTQAERVWKSTALPSGTYEPDVERGWLRFQLRVQARETQLAPVLKKTIRH